MDPASARRIKKQMKRDLYRLLGMPLYRECVVKRLLKNYPDLFINNVYSKNKVANFLYHCVFHMRHEEEDRARLQRRVKRKIRRANMRNQ